MHWNIHSVVWDQICLLRACRVLLHNDGEAPLTIHGLEPAAGSEAFVSAYVHDEEERGGARSDGGGSASIGATRTPQLLLSSPIVVLPQTGPALLFVRFEHPAVGEWDGALTLLTNDRSQRDR